MRQRCNVICGIACLFLGTSVLSEETSAQKGTDLRLR